MGLLPCSKAMLLIHSFNLKPPTFNTRVPILLARGRQQHKPRTSLKRHAQATDILSQVRFGKPNLPVPSVLRKCTFGHALANPSRPQRCPSQDGEIPLHSGQGAMVDPAIPTTTYISPEVSCSKLNLPWACSAAPRSQAVGSQYVSNTETPIYNSSKQQS